MIQRHYRQIAGPPVIKGSPAKAPVFARFRINSANAVGDISSPAAIV
jgi:hypothetical protein